MFEVVSHGVFRETGSPVFGMQDRGVSPGGALDRFSFYTGNILLENPLDSPACEIILPPRLRFRNDTFFVVTGAGFKGMTLKGSTQRAVIHGCVTRACAGDILDLGEKDYGFRAYLCYKKVKQTESAHMEGRKRGDFNRITRWYDPEGFIRVIDGPERSMLTNADDFFHHYYMIHHDSNAMGLRLMGPSLEARDASNMISGPVSDGTVQLTPNGLVVLLRHRQTLGGYPRIFNVISTDVDRLAQYAPGEHLRFRRVTMEDAMESLRLWNQDLEKLKANLSS